MSRWGYPIFHLKKSLGNNILCIKDWPIWQHILQPKLRIVLFDFLMSQTKWMFCRIPFYVSHSFHRLYNEPISALKTPPSVTNLYSNNKQKVQVFAEDTKILLYTLPILWAYNLSQEVYYQKITMYRRVEIVVEKDIDSQSVTKNLIFRIELRYDGTWSYKRVCHLFRTVPSAPDAHFCVIYL